MTLARDTELAVETLYDYGVIMNNSTTYMLSFYTLEEIRKYIHGNGDVNRTLGAIACLLSDSKYSSESRQFIIRHIRYVLAGTEFRDYDLSAAVRAYTRTATSA